MHGRDIVLFADVRFQVAKGQVGVSLT
jgi:hypothetical protein